MLNNGELMIFWGVTPNKGTYIIPSVQVNEDISKDIWGDKYQEYLAANYPHESFTLNAYKLYNGYLDVEKVSYTYPYQSISPYKFTYIAIKISGKTLFYFVNNVEVMPQRIRLYIELDNWGTYIGGAEISNIRVLRTNLQIAEFHEIPYRLPELSHYNNTHKRLYTAFGNDTRISINNLQIYAVIKHKTYTTFSTAIETIKTYSFNIRDIVGKGTEDNLTRQDIRQALEWTASIYAVTGVRNGEGDAELMHLYLFSNDLASTQGTGLYNNTFIGIINANKKEVLGFELATREYRLNIVVGNTVTYSPLNPKPSPIRNITALGREVYFGTKQNALKLPSFAGCLGVSFSVQCLGDRLLFKVEANSEERDITEAFEVVAVANTATLTSSQSTAKALGIMSNLASGAFQTAKGGVGAVSGPLAIANTFTNLVNRNNGSYIGGGSGWLTFEDILTNGSGDYLFFIVKDDSTSSEADAVQYLNKYGADCDYTIIPGADFFKYISARPYLSTPGTPAEFGEIKVLQATAEVSGIPYNAAEEIQARLNEGVRLKAISVNVRN